MILCVKIFLAEDQENYLYFFVIKFFIFFFVFGYKLIYFKKFK